MVGSAPRPSGPDFGEFEFKGGYPTPQPAQALHEQLKLDRAIESETISIVALVPA